MQKQYLPLIPVSLRAKSERFIFLRGMKISTNLSFYTHTHIYTNTFDSKNLFIKVL